jgi:3-(3-hydroxy-phenyl)propionate hydroxylase
MVVKGNANPGILDSYEEERRDHAWELIEMVLNLGQQIQPIDPALAAERDAFFAEVNKDPAAVAAVEEEMFQSSVERSVDKGLIVSSGCEDVAGRLLIQPELVVDGGRKLLDECIGTGLSIIGYDCDPTEELSKEDIASWVDIGASVVRIVSEHSTLNADSFLDESLELATWLGKREPVIMLVRPDRFCMACAGPGDAGAVLGRARGALTKLR